MMVKICGITNREDALGAIEGGASALGFNFYPKSPRYITPEEAARIFEVVPPSVWKVGVFVNEVLQGIGGLDILQLHGPGRQNCLPHSEVRLWRAVPVGPGFDIGGLERLVPAEAFLLDTASGVLYGGTGKTFDWSLARGAKHKIILAGGLDETNVREAIRQARPWGVDACSRLESAPGRKDHAKMRRFLQIALSEGS